MQRVEYRLRSQARTVSVEEEEGVAEDDIDDANDDDGADSKPFSMLEDKHLRGDDGGGGAENDDDGVVVVVDDDDEHGRNINKLHSPAQSLQRSHNHPRAALTAVTANQT